MQQTILDWLQAHYPTAKRTTLRRMVQAGRVRVNGAPVARVGQVLAGSDQVSVDERPSGPPSVRGQSPLRIVYEDADLLVVDKPPGLLTSTVPRERRPTLLAMVREYVGQADPRAPVGLIHRLDRDASGLLIFSKNNTAYRSLKSQFFDHAVERVYAAVVHGTPVPPAGRVESQLVERADGTVHTTRQIGKGQRAVTDYKLIRSEGGRSLLRVMLQTGRKHQIRVHLRQRGTPIVGDSVYGREGDDAPRLMLAAVRLALIHPRTGKPMAWDLPLPKEFPLRE